MNGKANLAASVETAADGDFFVRRGPGTVKLSAESAREYIRMRFGPLASPSDVERSPDKR